MSNISVDYDVLNQKQTPAFYASSLATRPAFGYDGRIFIDTDSPSSGIYRDTGSAWVQVADPGAGTTGTLQQVTTNGSSTTIGISTSGNGIGIGTTIPASNRLDIHSGSGINATFNGTGTTNAGLQLQNAGIGKWTIQNNYNAGANSFDIYNVANAVTTLSITNSQAFTFFGLNSSQFSFDNGKFSSTRTSASINLTIVAENRQSPALNIGSSIGFYGGTSANDPISEMYGAWEGSSINNSFWSLYTMTSGSKTEKFRINSLGYLGINTITPTYFLDVTGNGRFTSSLIALSLSTTTGCSFATSSGNVLIGTSTDDTVNKLQVNGSAKFSSYINAVGYITGQGSNPGGLGGSRYVLDWLSGSMRIFSYGADASTNGGFILNSQRSDGTNSINYLSISATGVTTISNLAGTGSRAVLADASGNLSAPVSDISVKENINTIGYGLSEILKMNPVWFDFIDEYKNYGKGRQNGNIAQEMEAIIPEAVFTTPSTGKMGINYDQLHAVYIKAIQELKAEIDALKNN